MKTIKQYFNDEQSAKQFSQDFTCLNYKGLLASSCLVLVFGTASANWVILSSGCGGVYLVVLFNILKFRIDD